MKKNQVIALIVLLCAMLLLWLKKKEVKKVINNTIAIMDSIFTDLIKHVLVNEGGYVNDPNDPGGETNFGISKRANPTVDIKNLTKDKATEIYYKKYWPPVAALKIQDKNLAYQVFDMCVNAGQTAALTLYTPTVDVKNYKERRLMYYKKLKGWALYQKSWSNRVNKTV